MNDTNSSKQVATCFHPGMDLFIYLFFNKLVATSVYITLTVSMAMIPLLGECT